MKKVRYIAVRVLIYYVVICLVLTLFQRSLIYHPTRLRDISVDSMVLQRPDADLRIVTWSTDSPRGLLYFGGNAEEVAWSLPDYVEAFPDTAIYMMTYRGYGGSQGRPSEAALHGDAQALYDLVRQKHAEVIVVGRSLGSGLAVPLAAKNDVSRLILITPFESLTAVAAGQFPIFPVHWLLWDRYESFRHAPHVTAPTLILAAEHDAVVPPHHARRLWSYFPPGVAEWREIGGAGHNAIPHLPNYLSANVNQRVKTNTTTAKVTRISEAETAP